MPIHNEIIANPKSERMRRISDLNHKKRREKSGRFIIEGPQSVREAIRYAADALTDVYVAVNGSEPDAPFISATVGVLAGEALNANLYVHKVTADVSEHIAPDAQGIFALARIDTYRDHLGTLPSLKARVRAAHDAHAMPLIAACWQVRDPGNAGAIIRAADASGAAGVVFVDDCVDVLSSKVIRSTAGSLFHIPVVTMRTQEFFDAMRTMNAHVMAADVYGIENKPSHMLPDILREMSDSEGSAQSAPTAPTAILFGNEARGLEASTIEQCDDVVTIPLYGHAESMNLATSAAVILMSLAMSSHIEKM